MESGRVSCVAFREGARLVKGVFVSMTTSEREANCSCIRYSSLRPVRDPRDRLYLVSEGTLDHAPPLLNPTHTVSPTSCPPGKLNERFTVPTEVDAGHVRPRGCVEKGWEGRGGTAAVLPWIIWLLVQLRDYPWFLSATVLINLSLSVTCLWIAGAHTSLQGFTFPSGFVYQRVCVCVHLPLLWPWWDIHLLCPLTDIVKSYNTLLISLLPRPLSPFLQSQLQLCALSLEQFRGRLLQLKDEHITGFLVKPLTVNNSGWRRMWHQPLVSNCLFWRRQTAFMVTFGSQNRQKEDKMSSM